MRPEKKKRHPKILIIEDNDSTRVLFREIFEMNNFEVILARTGEEGIRAAEDYLPAAIILDIGLPDINGIEVFSRLKSNQALKHIPVIACTGYVMSDDRRKCLDAGFDSFMSKPIDIARLISDVSTLIGSPPDC